MKRAPLHKSRTLAVLLTLLCSSASAKGPSVEELQRLADRAQAHHRAGRYEEALRDYEQAFRLERDPNLCGNVASLQRRLGRLREAEATFQVCLGLVRNDADRKAIAARLAAIRKERQAAPPVEAAGASGPTGVPQEAGPKVQASEPTAPAHAETPPKATPPLVHDAERSSREGLGCPQPAPPRTSLPTSPPTPLYRRAWFWTAAGLVVSGAVLVGGLCGHYCPDSRPYDLTWMPAQ